MHWKFLVGVCAAMAVLALGGWGALKIRDGSATIAKPDSLVPSAAVKRGDITFTVAAKGELQGGNSEMLTAPMIGGVDMSNRQQKLPRRTVLILASSKLKKCRRSCWKRFSNSTCSCKRCA